MSIGERLRRLRLQRGWSQGQLAIQARRYTPNAQLARETISRLENNRRPPDLWVLEACAAALGVGVDDLLRAETPAAARALVAEAEPVYEAPLADLAARITALPTQTQERIIGLVSGVLDVVEAGVGAAVDPLRQQMLAILDQLDTAEAAAVLRYIQQVTAERQAGVAQTGAPCSAEP